MSSIYLCVSSLPRDGQCIDTDGTNQCDKHSRKEEALAKLRQGQDWNAVAKEYSLDKPNQGGPPLY